MARPGRLQHPGHHRQVSKAQLLRYIPGSANEAGCSTTLVPHHGQRRASTVAKNEQVSTEKSLQQAFLLVVSLLPTGNHWKVHALACQTREALAVAHPMRRAWAPLTVTSNCQSPPRQ